MQGAADDVAGVSYRVEMREWGFAGTDLGESVGAVGLLDCFVRGLSFFSRWWMRGSGGFFYFGGFGHHFPVAHVHARLHD